MTAAPGPVGIANPARVAASAAIRWTPAPLADVTKTRQSGRRLNAMTVDVEDYFQVEAFANVIDRGDWDRMPRRVERNTDRLLELFETAGIKATFFVLGWVATRHEPLVRRIVAAGHELASHGSDHLRADRQSPEQFRADVRKAKRVLEDIGGVPVRGYRAATFSIGRSNWWAFEVLSEEGYAYSSSIYPIAHDLYGMPDAPRTPFFPTGSGFVEIPLTTLRAFRRNFPFGGGGYFRLFPYPVFRLGISRINGHDRIPCVFYCHPWEIDPDQPRQARAPWKSRLRHYLNLGRMERRLARLARDFAWGRMDEVFLDAPSLSK